jgi:hypothetical protein
MRLAHANNLHGIVAERLRVPSDNAPTHRARSPRSWRASWPARTRLTTSMSFAMWGRRCCSTGCTHLRPRANPSARSAMVLSANCRPRRGSSRRLAFHTPPLPDAGTVTFIDADSLLRWEYGKQKQGAGVRPHQDRRLPGAAAPTESPRGHDQHPGRSASDCRDPNCVLGTPARPAALPPWCRYRVSGQPLIGMSGRRRPGCGSRPYCRTAKRRDSHTGEA